MLALVPALRAADQPTAAQTAAALRGVSFDPERTYRVRELQLARGDIKIYLSEGVLSFLTPVGGRNVAAVFTTTGVEAGDAEILVLPPQRSERASLASFTKSPNLDEHFTSALFLFSDDTAKELLAQIEEGPVRKAPEVASQIAPITPSVRDVTADLEVRLIESLLDDHKPAQGFFYAVIAGGEIGTFDAVYDPTQFEPVSVGRVPQTPNGRPKFQLWTSFRPRHSPPFVSASARLSDYHVDATIHPDLTMSVSANFKLLPDPAGGRVLDFGLSSRLKVLSARIDGQPAEIFQHDSIRLGELTSSGTFLLVSDTPVSPSVEHTLEIRYEGSVVRRTTEGSYFVDERNAWYPHSGPMLTNFDLTFHCPDRLRLVSTGELMSDEVANGVRTVHRITKVPERLAGFNLGDYNLATEEHGQYRIECYANRSTVVAFDLSQASGNPLVSPSEKPDEALHHIASETESLLDHYTKRWMQLPIHSLAVSPIPGYFGQGFPGLVYLSTLSYMPQEDRPAQLRNPRMDVFFSQLLLPHEVAHQWWGNIVAPADYRTGWLMEAMANYSALQFLEQAQGTSPVDTMLDRYREDLLQDAQGKTIESAGPVDFGVRLLDAASPGAWHTIIYEKGAWILHMLRERLGDDAFNKMQVRLLREFAAKPISNEDFRRVASDFVPAGQPDKTLALFFDTWIYGTGIPKMQLRQTGKDLSLELSEVDEGFTADVPLLCKAKDGAEEVHWIRASSGSNTLELPRAGLSCQLPSSQAYLYSPFS